MKQIMSSLLALSVVASGLAVASAAQPVAAQQSRSDQDEARKQMKAGNALRLREIERRVIPQMKGAEYLGPQKFDPVRGTYDLKFIDGGKVINVVVDARTGKIIRTSR